MGPIALFDKSFLESLSLDESVWFDHFYIPNISPLFYVETLADLDKEMSRGRTAEQVVGGIASKSPELHGAPNVHHQELLLANLFGQHISMTNRPIIAGGRPVESKGKKGVNFDISPEAKAFNRWQNGEYLEIEREFARSWRAHLSLMNFDASAESVSKLGINIHECKNLSHAYKAAHELVSATTKPYELMGFVFNAFGVPQQYHQELIRRYQMAMFPPLTRYAPYAAHVAKVEIFFNISVARGFISADRPSNKVDIAYLYYLPFCYVFISGDRPHRNTAQLFLKDDQRFVWAPDLKSDLARLNEHYMELPEEVKNQGIMSFAGRPPKDGGFLTAKLWDLLGASWRKEESCRSGTCCSCARHSDASNLKMSGKTALPDLRY